MPDRTTLIVIDEAGRVRITSLEQVGSNLRPGWPGTDPDRMPEIQKKMARSLHLYSRIGFVRDFLPLTAAEVQKLFDGP